MYQGISSLFFFQSIFKVKQNNPIGNTMKKPICPTTHPQKTSLPEATEASDIKDIEKGFVERR